MMSDSGGNSWTCAVCGYVQKVRHRRRDVRYAVPRQTSSSPPKRRTRKRPGSLTVRRESDESEVPLNELPNLERGAWVRSSHGGDCRIPLLPSLPSPL